MLSQFLSASDPDSNTKYKLSHEEVHDEIITFIFGAFETTSSALSWFLYLMGKFTIPITIIILNVWAFFI